MRIIRCYAHRCEEDAWFILTGVRSVPAVEWGALERRWLRLSRRHAGHSMAVCAEKLQEEFLVSGGVSQPTISRWERGVTRQPHCISEILMYCDTYGPDREAVELAATSRGAVAAGTDNAPARAADSDDFLSLVARAADEPLLGPHQAELVRGMSQRLAKGPPLSPADRATYLDQLRVVGIKLT